MRTRIFLALALLAVLLPACSAVRLPFLSQPATPSPRAATRQPVPTYPLPPTSTATPPLPSATPVVPLSSDGPWLTYLSAAAVGSEVIAANLDGSARTVIGALPNVYVPLFARPTSAGAHWFSLQNGRDESLTLFELPTGKARKSFSLLSNSELSDNKLQMYANILNQKSPASQSWSPDGRFLAFTGAMDGPYTDLYVFDTQDASVKRLTGDLGESYYPTWTPDSSHVIVQEIQTQPASGTLTVRSLYLLPADGSGYKLLYQPASLAETIYGWIDPQTFIVSSRRSLGPTDARRFSLEKRNHAQLQYSGQMDLAALSPEKAWLAFTIAPKDKDVPSLAAGLYWTSPVTGPVQVARGKWQRLEWQPGAGRFFALGPGTVLSFRPGEDKLSFANEDNLPKSSPDGKWLAFFSAESGPQPGLRLYGPDGKLAQEVTQQPVQEVLWRPDSAGIFFVSGGELDYMPIPGTEPRLLGKGVSNLGWVGGE